MQTRLLIARHGNTFGPGDVVTRLGRTDLPLVASGLEQGRRLGRYLVAQRLVPDAIYTSQLQRTIETAEMAQQEMNTQVPVHALHLFNEIDYGPDENQPEELVVARLGAAALKAWDEEGVVPEGWQADAAAIQNDWKEFAARIVTEHAGQTVLVVTSNGIARFAPVLTGDFAAFKRDNPKLKIATGALCIFTHHTGSAHWLAEAWNIVPAKQ